MNTPAVSRRRFQDAPREDAPSDPIDRRREPRPPSRDGADAPPVVPSMAGRPAPSVARGPLKLADTEITVRITTRTGYRIAQVGVAKTALARLPERERAFLDAYAVRPGEYLVFENHAPDYDALLRAIRARLDAAEKRGADDAARASSVAALLRRARLPMYGPPGAPTASDVTAARGYVQGELARMGAMVARASAGAHRIVGASTVVVEERKGSQWPSAQALHDKVAWLLAQANGSDATDDGAVTFTLEPIARVSTPRVGLQKRCYVVVRARSKALLDDLLLLLPTEPAEGTAPATKAGATATALDKTRVISLDAGDDTDPTTEDNE